MTNTEDPAATSGGNTGTPAHPALADLPDRLRVHALAKLLDRSSREVLDTLAKLGEQVRSPQSSLDREIALRVAETLLATPAEPDATTPPAAADEAAGEPEPEPAPGLVPVFAAPAPVFLPPTAPSGSPPAARPAPAKAVEPAESSESGEDAADSGGEAEQADDDASRRRRRRGRRGRGRGRGNHGEDGAEGGAEESAESGADTAEPAAAGDTDTQDAEADESDETAGGEDGGNRRRRRRRRRRGTSDDAAAGTEDDPPNTVVHVRTGREAKADRGKADTDGGSGGQDEVRSVRGSTRLEAKRQRRRDGREAGRRRVPILSEAEFLARREAVDRKMVVLERGDRVQIGVLEDGVLVEHFVTSSGSGSLVGNVYLGRVQNVLPSMEAAFVDIGRGRNAVLYAGEVDWDAAGLEGKARKIEQALSTGDSVLVQVTKDPVGHKGARLTTQISLPGRFLVYVPGGGATGISRKLPDTERKRLKDVLKRVVPEDAGVIIRTASEGISEEELARDVRRLRAQWDVIKDRSGQPKAKAPQLLYEEPDLLIKVVRDLFTEDFSALVVQGNTAWDTIEAYVTHVAPDLVDRLKRHAGNVDVFTTYRIDEQILKALDRKVWLPSGGYLVIDRTEAMTVIDVNTGKFTGSGGNLEETVTRNNLEAAEEIVRQLRLRDIGGIIVIDFIDMVLESNRDLVLRRLTECLGRDRTRHQVAEVTSLGLVQMTRKRIGTGLLEAYSTPCEHCRGRGVIVSTTLPMAAAAPDTGRKGNGRSNGHDHTPPEPPKVAESKAAKVEEPKVEEATAAPVEPVEPQPEPVAVKAPDEPSPATEPAEPVVVPEPATEPEVAGEPVAEPAAESGPEPVAEPVVAQPVEPAPEATAEPETTPEPEPVAEQPAGPEPAEEPVRPEAEPVRPEPVVAEQPAEHSAEPTAPAPEPGTEQAETEQPETEQAEQAGTEQPETEQAEQAGTEQAETEQAETEQVETEQAEAGDRNGYLAAQEPVVGSPLGPSAAQRRQRRAASRPAGPPVSISTEG